MEDFIPNNLRAMENQRCPNVAIHNSSTQIRRQISTYLKLTKHFITCNSYKS